MTQSPTFTFSATPPEVPTRRKVEQLVYSIKSLMASSTSGQPLPPLTQVTLAPL